MTVNGFWFLWRVKEMYDEITFWNRIFVEIMKYHVIWDHLRFCEKLSNFQMCFVTHIVQTWYVFLPTGVVTTSTRAQDKDIQIAGRLVASDVNSEIWRPPCCIVSLYAVLAKKSVKGGSAVTAEVKDAIFQAGTTVTVVVRRAGGENLHKGGEVSAFGDIIDPCWHVEVYIDR